MPDDFEKDLHSANNTGGTSKCIINLIRTKASPQSEDTMAKCITSNFLICSLNCKLLDSWYFCYQFNEGKSIKQQISKYHQGNTLSVKKLNVKSIERLKIPIFNIEKQRLIGQIYRQSLIQKDRMIQQAENTNKLAMEIIKKIMEN